MSSLVLRFRMTETRISRLPTALPTGVALGTGGCVLWGNSTRLRSFGDMLLLLPSYKRCISGIGRERMYTRARFGITAGKLNLNTSASVHHEQNGSYNVAYLCTSVP